MTTLQIISLTALQLALLYFTYRCGYSWGHWNGLHEGYYLGKSERQDITHQPHKWEYKQYHKN